MWLMLTCHRAIPSSAAIRAHSPLSATFGWPDGSFTISTSVHAIPPRQPVPSTFKGEVVSDIKTRAEGVRIKHRMNRNSVKAYDKVHTNESAVLRIEPQQLGRLWQAVVPREGECLHTLIIGRLARRCNHPFVHFNA